MTQFEPTLILKRLRIEKDGHSVYDEKFHLGTNVIRGDNSSGKSTILNFIYFALGGDLSDWSEDAIRCTRVLAEVDINGSNVTLGRDVSEKSSQPMDIFSGSLSEALDARSDQWLRYPYKRSARESFSQALFRLMNVPEAAGDGTGNLTMNQVLRLLYADQLSPIENLFKYEGRWDTPTIRDAVGRLLCGANETQIYENQIRIRTLSSEFDKIDAELKAVFTAFGHSGENLTKSWVELQKKELAIELDALILKIESVERQQLISDQDELTTKAQDAAYSEVQDNLAKMASLKTARDSLSLSIMDIERYVSSIRNRLRSLKESSMVS
ncbi:AAA family ATPase, partial [bacterium]|nr:AAA family ATPase [bacterium]